MKSNKKSELLKVVLSVHQYQNLMKTKKCRTISEILITNKKMKITQYTISKQIKNCNFTVVNYQMQQKIQIYSSEKMYNKMKKMKIEMLVLILIKIIL
jgi:hypothetical protein